MTGMRTRRRELSVDKVGLVVEIKSRLSSQFNKAQKQKQQHYTFHLHSFLGARRRRVRLINNEYRYEHRVVGTSVWPDQPDSTVV